MKAPECPFCGSKMAILGFFYRHGLSVRCNDAKCRKQPELWTNAKTEKSAVRYWHEFVSMFRESKPKAKRKEKA